MLQNKIQQAMNETRGLTCPKCGCSHFEVVYTRSAIGGKIVRRRQCRHCGRRVLTCERIVG